MDRSGTGLTGYGSRWWRRRRGQEDLIYKLGEKGGSRRPQATSVAGESEQDLARKAAKAGATRAVAKAR